VKAFRSIRHVRIVPKPLIQAGGGWVWQEVLV
jgi:hypothetical protein